MLLSYTENYLVVEKIVATSLHLSDRPREQVGLFVALPIDEVVISRSNFFSNLSGLNSISMEKITVHSMHLLERGKVYYKNR